MVFEKIDRIVIKVRDLEKAKEDYSKLFGISFTDVVQNSENLRVRMPRLTPEEIDAEVGGRRFAISDSGIELMQAGPGEDEGLYCLLLKVTDQDKANGNLADSGAPCILDITWGGLTEAVYALHGSMVGIASYGADSPLKALEEAPSTS
ncbi:VOC family protein [Saccharopolyspora phatthalungensis]|uniref:Putative enzyme related to lactoylglutathione lyase n=1 Tax=Saccharopolyspora phatthalungensis TaxID=664693 RepID=A0A840QFN0_9PSEU|nr:VOC family protein [Saccharopolyspora phatthalungensis]MBB5158881.1 putative enzyme related to lactoylglutathione lyase [Saccharopolyspora phatthalungensis]